MKELTEREQIRLTNIESWLRDDLQACVEQMAEVLHKWVRNCPEIFTQLQSTYRGAVPVYRSHTPFTVEAAYEELRDTALDAASGYIASCDDSAFYLTGDSVTAWRPEQKELRTVPMNPATPGFGGGDNE